MIVNIVLAISSFKEALKAKFKKLSDDMLADRLSRSVLSLLIFKFCQIVGISKINFFNFFSKEGLNEVKEKVENSSKPRKFTKQSIFKKIQQKPNITLVFH